LCAFAALADGHVTVIDDKNKPLEQSILLLRRGARVTGFVNCCPHMGFTLDWKADRIALDGGAFLRCVHHGALFRSSDGLCVAGPCPGESLTQVRIEIVDGDVVLSPEASS
jgi:nitrite reductase/ring-hydroxylating ferredoxin subunit